MDLVEEASADDDVEGAGSADDAAEDASDVSGIRTAADSQDAPSTSSWPALRFQQHGRARSLSHQPPQPAAAAKVQQQGMQPSRVHVSAVTGAGLGLLLQEIDRKVCFDVCNPHHGLPEQLGWCAPTL